jgi:anti-sigma regulatory factor (Ser/Thr protein kinase)
MPLPASRVAATLEFAPGDILVLISDGLTEYRDTAGEEFGHERIHQVLLQHQGKSMAEVADLLLQSVHAFAGGAPQEDDVTAVLIQRAIAPTRSFARNPDSLEAIFDFIGGIGLDASLRMPVEFAVEELFTNMVKYGKGSTEIRLTLSQIPGGVEVTLIDHGSEPFDITKVPDADIGLPIEQREPGGLGLHLVRRMVDSLEYEYREDLRQTRISFRKTGGGHVHD